MVRWLWKQGRFGKFSDTGKNQARVKKSWVNLGNFNIISRLFFKLGVKNRVSIPLNIKRKRERSVFSMYFFFHKISFKSSPVKFLIGKLKCRVPDNIFCAVHSKRLVCFFLFLHKNLFWNKWNNFLGLIVYKYHCSFTYIINEFFSI